MVTATQHARGERRKTRRYPYIQKSLFSINYGNSVAIHDCDIYDISEGGISFHSRKDVDEGQEISILINFRYGIIREKARIIRRKQMGSIKYAARFAQPSSQIWSLMRELAGRSVN